MKYCDPTKMDGAGLHTSQISAISPNLCCLGQTLWPLKFQNGLWVISIDTFPIQVIHSMLVISPSPKHLPLTSPSKHTHTHT